MKIKLLLAIALFSISGGLVAQDRSHVISGRISTEQGSYKLPSITVRSAVSKRATATDSDGLFQISIPSLPDTLLITHLGYEPLSIPLSDRTPFLDLVLQPQTFDLDEVTVVNTGYQTVKPNEINGSTVSLGASDLNQQSGTNLLDRLNNITSGLSFTTGKSNGNPQNTTNISIRGLSTINGPLDPLIVLDNFIYEGDINNINPNDVENVTILKDASAASIWGARAGNGVIVITTKRGKFNQPLRIGFNSNIIIADKPDLYYYPQMSSSDYIDVERLLFNEGYFDDQITGTPYAALTPAVEVFLKNRSGQISDIDAAKEIDRLKSVDIRDGYSRHFLKKGVTQQHALNLQGGGDKHNFNLSSAYDQNVNESHARFSKINLKADHTFRPLRDMAVTTGLYFTHSTSESGRPGYNTVQVNGRWPTYLSFADENGDPASIQLAYREAYTDTVGGGRLLNWRYYPLEDYKHNRSTTKQQEIYANAGANYKLTSYLNIDAKYQYQRQSSDTENLSDIESYNARNLINSFSQLNRTTGIVDYIVPLGGIRRLSMRTVESHTFRTQLNLDRAWGYHRVSAIAGWEVRQAKGSGNGYAQYGYNEDPLSYTDVDFVNYYPHFITGNSQGISSNGTLSSTVHRFVSGYMNASYNFKGRYLISASARQDGSNIFGANTNDRWKPLWSAGIGWNISKENFYKAAWVPYLKLTATYGHSGNVDLSRSALPVATYGTYAATGLRLARINTLNNPELRWEQSSQLNLRIDFASAGQRIAGSLEYYRKKGTDLYGTTPYDYTTWGRGSEIVRNVAAMEGNGIDIVLNSKNIEGSLRWNTSLLFNYNISKTREYFSPSANIVSTSTGNSISPIVGKPLYAIAAYRWGGLDASGNPQGYRNGDLSTDYTEISKEGYEEGTDGNVRYMGSSVPEYFGSLINTFQWKKFSASINIGYKFGYYLFKPTISYAALVQNGRGHADYENRWQKPGDESITDIPSFTYPLISGRDAFFASSEVNVIKGDHIRLNYINLGYELFSKKEGLPFERLQLFAIASNLGILWRANGDRIDPDNDSIYPEPRTVTIGLRSNF
ncbi:SusC/RagA family TonB-linked outer membrane protein [Sphingobacterium chuzhouense]|uniref:SusC/RagA family TonB-linked outer membrane protein n=1 Tax=Sphingobacterium chuzhouense TaxID=1742264 RepID=A0ABR7XP99_9SPHI|nr:SusC/RagA family TonB-linked outer membrane protein [Sphingobacterium chuzhouense]MBD1421000.1 SusC/RagA family TonB-linked outer membrane protein [Sphingobacterium chuzhouense]